MKELNIEILRLAEIIEMEEVVDLMATVRKKVLRETGQLYQKNSGWMSS